MLRRLRADTRTPDAQADLYLVGLGIGGWDRRTVEADDILRQCRSVLHLTAFDDELRALCSGTVTDLRRMYGLETEARKAYERMTVAVLQQAQKAKGQTAFVTYGHPLFLVDTSWDILVQCQNLPLVAKVIPGTSSLDQIMSDLPVRFDFGFQVFEANHLVQQDVSVNASYALVITQVGDFGTSTLRPSSPSSERLAPLASALRRQIPESHGAHLIFSSWRHDMAPVVKSSTVADLGMLLGFAHVGCSLVIAPSND